MAMDRRAVWAMSVILAAGCASGPQPDAYGNVEATEVTVTAEVTGRLTAFEITDGQMLDTGSPVGLIDDTPLTLERNQLVAQQAATSSRLGEVAGQIQAIEAQRRAAEAQQAAAMAQAAALRTELEIARRAYERTQRLVAQQAATAQQLDQAERAFKVLEDQVKAQDQQVEAQARQVEAQSSQLAAAEAQQRTARDQVSVAQAQVARTDERIAKTRVRNPVAGTVLVTYARVGELVQPGQPLYKIADLGVVDVRAYVTQTQLANITVGQGIQVTFDVGPDERRTLTGTVSWVSDRAEFTPTPIQTRDERADLVYAIKVRVPNEARLLKIGMPVDVQFPTGQPQ